MPYLGVELGLLSRVEGADEVLVKHLHCISAMSNIFEGLSGITT